MSRTARVERVTKETQILVEPQIVDDGREIMTLRKEGRLLKWAGENRLLIGIIGGVFDLFQVKIADLGACSRSPENLCAPALYQGTVGVFDAGPDVVDIAAVVAVDELDGMRTSLGRICAGLTAAYNVALAKIVPTARVHLPFAYYLLKSQYFQGPPSGGRSAQERIQ